MDKTEELIYRQREGRILRYGFTKVDRKGISHLISSYRRRFGESLGLCVSFYPNINCDRPYSIEAEEYENGKRVNVIFLSESASESDLLSLLECFSSISKPQKPDSINGGDLG